MMTYRFPFLANSPLRLEKCLVIVGLLIIASSTARAQWDTKPYQQWTQEEVQKLLTESPWAQTHYPGTSQTSAGAVSPRAVTLRLRSAIVVRQALMRLRQLKSDYDRMNDRDKAKFDEKNLPLLECPACAGNYVVSLSPGPGSKEGVPSMLKTMPIAEAKLDVYLVNELGERRALVHYVPPKVTGDDAVFFFARLNDKGEPLIKPNNQKLVVLLGSKILLNVVTKTSFVFDVTKMRVQGQVVF